MEYQVNYWLKTCPQDYLMGTEYGHKPDVKENPLLFEDEDIRMQILGGQVQFVSGERVALMASSALVNLLPDHESKAFMATQTLDEARHVEIFRQRMLDLKVKEEDIESTISDMVNPNLIKFGELLAEVIDKKDYIAGIMGQNIILEGLAFSTFEFSLLTARFVDPVGAQVLEGVIKDERRHVGFGENRLRSIAREFPEKRSKLQKLQREMSHYVVETFRSIFKEMAPMIERSREKYKGQFKGIKFMGYDMATTDPLVISEAIIEQILTEFKTRLERLGLEYQDPR